MAVVTYPLSAFANTAVYLPTFETEVRADSALNAKFLYSENPGSNVNLTFESALTGPEQTALDAIVAAHQGVVLPLEGPPGEPNGVATLDGGGQLTSGQLPTITAGDVGADPNGTAASLIAAHEAAPDPHAQYTTAAEAAAAAPVQSVNGQTGAVVISTGAVDSVFGRTGAVVAQASDYDASQIDNDSTILGSTVADALNNLASAGRTVFAIWAEENSGLNAGAYEWAYGNGDDTVAGSGIPVALDAVIFAVGLDHNTTGSATVAVEVDGVQVATVTTSSERNTINQLVSPVAVTAGQVVGFRTVSGTGSASGNRVVAYLRTPNSSGTLAPVDSVFGRTGPVVAQASDYDASQVDNDSSVSGATVADALDTLAGASGGGVDVEDEGGAVTGSPFDTVNFVGLGVSAAPGAADTVDVTIPGPVEIARGYDAPLSVSTSTSFQTKVAVTLPELPPGTYEIEATYGWAIDSTGNDFEGRITFNGSQIGELHKQEGKDAAGGGVAGTTQRMYVSRKQQTVVASTISAGAVLDLDWRTDAGGVEATIFEANLILRRLS